MSCNDIRDRLDNLWESNIATDLRQHLSQCATCREYQLDLRLVRSGFRLLQLEEMPQPSLGFAERVVRRLGEIGKAPSVAEFFERVGRRFVYATLALTSLALLALAVPSTGPVRGLSSNDIQISSQEASLAYSDPVGDPGVQEAPELAPAETPEPAVTNEVK